MRREKHKRCEDAKMRRCVAKKAMKNKLFMHPDLPRAQQYAYEPCELVCKNLLQEAESREYGACTFNLN